MLAHGAVPATSATAATPSPLHLDQHVVCHGIPASACDGRDIIHIDVTVSSTMVVWRYSRMYVAGAPSTRARLLMDVTYDAMMKDASRRSAGGTLGMSACHQAFVEKNRFSVVRDFCGHGIGLTFHARANVLHSAGRRRAGAQAGISSPWTVVNAGRPEVRILDDGDGGDRDRAFSAQYETWWADRDRGGDLTLRRRAATNARPA